MQYPAFQDIGFSPEVVSFFSQALAQDKLAQSYIFAAPPAANPKRFAYALAKAIFCERGGCNRCKTCKSIDANAHVDVHVMSPASAQGYLIEQAREITRTAAQSAATGEAKLFIIDSADKLFGAPANALLKTIEEPPAHTHFIFITPSLDRMLPTIVSRSQVIPFKSPSQQFLHEYVRGVTGADDLSVSIALATFKNPDDTLFFLHAECSAALREARVRLLQMLLSLARITPLEIIEFSKELVEHIDAAASQESAKKKKYDDAFYSAHALKEAEAAEKRLEKAAEARITQLMYACICSFFEDLLKLQQVSTAKLLANQDIEKELQSYAATLDETQLLASIKLVQERLQDITRNVGVELSFEALLLGLKEVICPR